MQEKEAKLKRKKRKRNKSGIAYLLLFTIVFVIALCGLSYAVKSLSPDVDVEIGNNEALAPVEQETDVEMRTVDERLKWIQMEDELPSVAVRNPETKKEDNKESTNDNKKEKDENKTVKEEVINLTPTVEKTQKNTVEPTKTELDFRLPSGNVIEPRQPIAKTVTKVYLGGYDSIEEAIKTQQKVASEEPDMIPFIKAINGRYMVQIGSFSDHEKAIALSLKMKEKGYPSKTVTE